MTTLSYLNSFCRCLLGRFATLSLFEVFCKVLKHLQPVLLRNLKEENHQLVKMKKLSTLTLGKMEPNTLIDWSTTDTPRGKAPGAAMEPKGKKRCSERHFQSASLVPSSNWKADNERLHLPYPWALA